MLTVGEVAKLIGVTFWTINRWYKWYENEDEIILAQLRQNGMPDLPKYSLFGPNKWKIWEEKDIEQLKKFKEFMPNTRGGFMGSLNKKGKK